VKPLPAVQSATLQRLAANTPEGDTKLEAMFEPGQNVSPANYFVLDEQLYLLRDDGVAPDAIANDGTNTVIIPFGTNDMVTWNDHVDQIADLNEPIFKGREIIGTNQLQKFAITDYMTYIKIPLWPLPCRLGSSKFYDFHKTLIITDLSVVEDPTRTWEPATGVGTKMGVWTFGSLMTNIANTPLTGITGPDFVRNWLRYWETDQVINFDLVPNRQAEILSQVITDWQTKSGGPAAPLDLSIAPFRLLAIVNRVDLRDNTFPIENAGELRFVFEVVTTLPGGGPGGAPFTVILEYGVPKKGCNGVRNWALQWAGLNALPFGPGFNAALQAITDQITPAGSDPSRPPNLSALNQLRSNELLQPPWDLREFVLAASGFLQQNTVKNTPQTVFNNTPLITTFCNDLFFIPKILADAPDVPLLYLGNPFLAGESEVLAGGFGGTFWNGSPPGSILTFGARRHFSLNTCNGCHGGETATGFTHISVRSPGVPSTLSGFLTGIVVPDPAGFEPPTIYNDILRRLQDLDGLVRKPCLCFALSRPLRMSH
jgi:hypothetical protein